MRGAFFEVFFVLVFFAMLNLLRVWKTAKPATSGLQVRGLISMSRPHAGHVHRVGGADGSGPSGTRLHEALARTLPFSGRSIGPPMAWFMHLFGLVCELLPAHRGLIHQAGLVHGEDRDAVSELRVGSGA